MAQNKAGLVVATNPVVFCLVYLIANQNYDCPGKLLDIAPLRRELGVNSTSIRRASFVIHLVPLIEGYSNEVISKT
jgi:hypothetical protein